MEGYWRRAQVHEARHALQSDESRLCVASRLDLRYGRLALKELTLDTADNVQPTKAEVSIDGRAVEVKVRVEPSQVTISFPQGLDLSAGQTLDVKLSS